MADVASVSWALAELNPMSQRLLNYAQAKRYYEGDHPLAFATDKFRSRFWSLFQTFSLNMCSSVVDIQAERLEIVGFVSDEGTFDPATMSTNDPIGAAAWDAWERGRLDIVADRLHDDVLKYGDGFLIGQPVKGGGMAVRAQNPFELAVHYSDAVDATIDLAAKLYIDDVVDDKVRWCLYVYEPGVVTKFEGVQPVSDDMTPEQFEQVSTASLAGGLMPVWHFPNKAMYEYGVSELRDVYPIQDALNKTVVDMLVASEYQAFRQRWATGAETDDLPDAREGSLDLLPHQIATGPEGQLVRRPESEHGPGTMLMFPNPDTRIGEFGQADISPFVMTKNAFQADVARVAGVPLSYFFVSTSETPSGEALAKAEVRFQRKGRRQKRTLGNQWERILTQMVGVADEVDLNAVWLDDSARSETEKLNASVLKQTLGVPNAALQKELGYDDAEIAAFAEAAKGEAQQPHDVATVEPVTVVVPPSPVPPGMPTGSPRSTPNRG